MILRILIPRMMLFLLEIWIAGVGVLGEIDG